MESGVIEFCGLAGLLLAIFALASCSTTAGFLDAALPDRYGLGSTFTSGVYSGRQIGQTGGDTTRETGKYELDSIVTWLEWDIPSLDSEPVSVRGVRDRVVNDYEDWRESPSESLVSVTRRTTVDEATGEIQQSWGFGLSEALSSAVVGLLSYAGFRMFRARRASVGGLISGSADEDGSD